MSLFCRIIFPAVILNHILLIHRFAKELIASLQLENTSDPPWRIFLNGIHFSIMH
jgi:hypothetical protein